MVAQGAAYGSNGLCSQWYMIKRALTLVAAMHITASVFINDDESGLHHDYEVWLERLAPHAPVDQYWHNRTGEDNADAHLKRQIMGREVVVAVTSGRLDFGCPGRELSSVKLLGDMMISLATASGSRDAGLPTRSERRLFCSPSAHPTALAGTVSVDRCPGVAGHD